MDKQKMVMLAVDDELAILKILKEVFEQRQWNVIITPTGNSIWQILEKVAVDIILLDMQLPDCSGLDILKELKKRMIQTPVVVFTARDYDDELVKQAFALGAAGYSSKTASIIELQEVVNNALL